MSSQQTARAIEHFNKLRDFRQEAYGLFGNARDALFELSDALLQLPHLQCLAELSCAPVFRRQWPSTYEALQDSRPDRSGLLQLYLAQCDPHQRLVLVGDHTAWPRLWAETVAGRSYQHQPTPIPGRRPITLGWGYSSLAIIPAAHRSWALPLLFGAIPQQKPIETASQQLRQVCACLTTRPLALFDAEYGCATFVRLTADLPVDLLLRLRTNLVLEGATRPRRSPKGRAPIHGVKFKFKDPATWGPPEATVSYTDPDLGPVVVRQWSGLRFQQALEQVMTVAQVERPQATGTRRKPKILWFAWRGPPPPDHWWCAYGQRYPIEHWYRFIKGQLHWTLPHLATAAQAQRWSDLMVFLTWELWLARAVVADSPLPWQKPLAQLSPGRVRQGMGNLLSVIGTPTRVCKTRGKAPGWPSGRSRTKREPQAVVQSAHWKAKRERQQAKKEAQAAGRGPPQTSRPAPGP